jgi:hypothetical protein
MGTQELSIAEKMLLSTIRIETQTSLGTCTGTGFFLELKHDPLNNMSVPVVVTNKHVIKDAKTGKLRFSVEDNDGNPMWGDSYDVTFDNFESRWIMHPDENIDLCVLPIASIHQLVAKQNKRLLYASVILDDIPSDEVLKREYSRIEDITVIGYPDGIWDSVNNNPIVRKGITATPLQADFNGASDFLVDVAIYPGSSGSPVYIFNQGAYATSAGINIGSRVSLVGVIHATFQHRINGSVGVVDVPAAKVPIFESMIPNNLGLAIHARKLRDFEQFFPD